MRLRKQIGILAAAFALGASLAGHAGACSCNIRPANEAFEHADVVFTGYVRQIENAPFIFHQGNQEIPLRDLRVEFGVLDVWKGDITDTIALYTGREETACGYPFQAGRTYLVYAGWGTDGYLQTHLCTRTKRIEHAKADYQALGLGNMPPHVPDFWELPAVGFSDFILFATAFNARRGETHFNPIADLNDDGVVDFSDFIAFLPIFTTMNPIVPLAGLVSKDDIHIEEMPNPDDETLQTRIVIPFFHPIRLIRRTHPWISTPVIDLETGEERPRAPTIAQTALDTTRLRLTLLVDGLISAGGTFELRYWDIGLLNAYQTLVGSVALPATRSPLDSLTTP